MKKRIVLFILSTVLLANVSCAKNSYTINVANNNNIAKNCAELVLMQNHDEIPHGRFYSPDGKNFISYKFTHKNDGTASDEYPEINVYLNNFTEPIDIINSTFAQRKALQNHIKSE